MKILELLFFNFHFKKKSVGINEKRKEKSKRIVNVQLYTFSLDIYKGLNPVHSSV